MNNYLYSPSENAFYPEVLRQNYVDAGAWPDDLIEVSTAIYQEYGEGLVPENKVRIAGNDGFPAWGDIPVDYLVKAENERQRLLKEADDAIADWLIDLQLGIIMDEDKKNLILWRAYIKNLKALELSGVRDEKSYGAIAWPVKPL